MDRKEKSTTPCINSYTPYLYPVSLCSFDGKICALELGYECINKETDDEQNNH